MGGRPKGSKNIATLDKESRKAMFDEHISQKFLEIVDKARPEYVLDQFLGKPREIIELQGLDFKFDKDEENSIKE